MSKTYHIKNYSSLTDAIKDIYADDVSIVSRRHVSGGDINRAYAIELSGGRRIFMKANDIDKLSFFETEVAGLAAIASTGQINTPKVLGIGADTTGAPYAFLLLSFIEAAPKNDDYWEVFGHELASMHMYDTKRVIDALTKPHDAYEANDKSQTNASDIHTDSHITPHMSAHTQINRVKCATYILSDKAPFGFISDNYIGASDQINSPGKSFIEFFRDCRLIPQFRMAESYFSAADKKSIDYLLGHMDRFYIEPEHPSLLHGDLWSGNAITADDGKAVIIDPAAYIGHAEADLAMTELFGRFPQRFYDAYKEIYPLQIGYEKRKDFYNLYHLLNHLNLFGIGYLSSVRGILMSI